MAEVEPSALETQTANPASGPPFPFFPAPYLIFKAVCNSSIALLTANSAFA